MGQFTVKFEDPSKHEKTNPRLDHSSDTFSGIDRVNGDKMAGISPQPADAMEQEDSNSTFDHDFDNFMDELDATNPIEEYNQWPNDIALQVEMGFPIPDSPPPSKVTHITIHLQIIQPNGCQIGSHQIRVLLQLGEGLG